MRLPFSLKHRRVLRLLFATAATVSGALAGVTFAQKSETPPPATRAAESAADLAAESAPTQNTSTNAPQPQYLAESCNDGDTCRLKAADNVTLKVRLVGIDAPESGGGPGKGGRPRKKQGQPFSAESKQKLNALVQGKHVTLRTYGVDGFNRNLAELYVGKTNVNLEMVRGGYAETYQGRPPKGLDVEAYAQAQAEAKAAHKGVWALDSYESPKDFRKRTK